MATNRYEREESGKLVVAAALAALTPEWEPATVIASRTAFARSRINTALIKLAATDKTVGVTIKKGVSYFRRQGVRGT